MFRFRSREAGDESKTRGVQGRVQTLHRERRLLQAHERRVVGKEATLLRSQK